MQLAIIANTAIDTVVKTHLTTICVVAVRIRFISFALLRNYRVTQYIIWFHGNKEYLNM